MPSVSLPWQCPRGDDDDDDDDDEGDDDDIGDHENEDEDRIGRDENTDVLSCVFHHPPKFQRLYSWTIYLPELERLSTSLTFDVFQFDPTEKRSGAIQISRGWVEEEDEYRIRLEARRERRRRVDLRELPEISNDTREAPWGEFVPPNKGPSGASQTKARWAEVGTSERGIIGRARERGGRAKVGWEGGEGGAGGDGRSALDHRTSSSGAVSADKDRHGDGQDGRPTGLSTSQALRSATTSLPSEDLSSACSVPFPREASWGSLFIRRRPRLTPIVPFHPRAPGKSQARLQIAQRRFPVALRNKRDVSVLALGRSQERELVYRGVFGWTPSVREDNLVYAGVQGSGMILLGVWKL
ncbi:hypothetical protein KM043_008160 [Ampulex compressa]|nr:hypothetical protein KM043_008160 [Ampulex compressa]